MDRHEVEQLIASQICQAPELISSLSVSLDDFGDWISRDIIRAVEKMERDGVKVTRADMPRYAGSVERPDIARIWNYAKTRANFDSQVSALSDMVKAEKLDFLAGSIMTNLSDGAEPDAIINQIEERLFAITLQSRTFRPEPIGECIRQSMDRLELKIKNPGLPGITTGYHELNDSFGGFEGGKLYYVGARPSQGKTALMLNFALHVLSAGKSIGIVSVESNEKELADRMLSISSSVNAMAMKRGKVVPSEISKLSYAVNNLYSKPGQVYHNPYATIADVAIQGRRMVRNHSIDVLFIDYVQLISGGSEWITKPRHLEVAYVSRQLKGLASDIDIPIVCLAQIGRNADGKAPRMSDFAESSALEKDADVMMAIHHEDRDGEEYSCIKVLKARDGLTGEAPVRFIREYLKFIEVDGI